jgi:F-type H+-transporting ATPase subunit b
MEIVTQNELVSINATLLVQAVSFLLFLLLIERVMFSPLRRSMEERRVYLTGLRGELERQEREIAAMTALLDRETAEAKREAFVAAEKVAAGGKREAQALMRQVHSEIAALWQAESAAIPLRIARHRERLAQEAEPLAAAMIDKILGRSVQR